MSKTTYPVTSFIPQPVLGELVMSRHVQKAHLTNIGLWPSRLFELIGRVAGDKTRVGALGTKPVVVVVSFELRDFVRVRVGGGGGGVAIGRGAESMSIVRRVAFVRRSQSTLLGLTIAYVVEFGSIDPRFEVLASRRAIFLGRIKKEERDESSRRTAGRKRNAL